VLKQGTAKENRRRAGQILPQPDRLRFHLAEGKRTDVGGLQDLRQILRFRPALGLKVARVVETKLDTGLLQSLAQQVLIELIRSLVTVQPAADRRDQALGLGQHLAVDRRHPPHGSDQPGI
jgi:hypothetical protein